MAGTGSDGADPSLLFHILLLSERWVFVAHSLFTSLVRIVYNES
ncbi:hypothetical protein [Thermogemmatispora sp.]|nr:hypothetical protein [Thermogemmatispora sp.]